MEIRDLRALASVIRLGSFTAAARELGYTQSAISQQVAALEAELGQQLLLRRPVRATPAGERLAEHAQKVLVRLEVARAELVRLAPGPTRVRVVTSPLASPDLLAGALRAARSVDALLEVHVVTADQAAAVAAVAAGGAEIGLVDGVSAPGEPLQLAEAGLLRVAPVAEAPLVVALPATHPLAGATGLDLAALADAPWVITPAVAGSGSAAMRRAGAGFLVPDQRASDAPAQRAGLRRRAAGVLYDGSDLATLAALVRADLGMALLPAGVCAGLDGIVGVPLRSPRLVHRSEVLLLRSASGRAAQLAASLRLAGG